MKWTFLARPSLETICNLQGEETFVFGDRADLCEGNARGRYAKVVRPGSRKGNTG